MFCKQTFVKLLLVAYRNSCISIRCKSDVRMTKQLKKMMTKGPKKKAWYSQPTPVSPDILSQPTHKGYTEGQRRRAVQVGKVLYGYIVQIVNSGELCPQLAEMAVCIDKVVVIPDFSAINVHWLSSGSEEEDKTETLLRENAGKLRHILTSYHLLGRIPIINFVKDNQAMKSLEVEKLLSIADFGPDFQPTTYATQIRTGTGKSNIAHDFAKLSLRHTDSQAYPDIMTVSSTGDLVFENAPKVEKAMAVDAESKESAATSKETINGTDKEGLTLAQRTDMVNKEQKDFTDKYFAPQNIQFDTDPESRVKFCDDKRTKIDDLDDFKFKNDVYALQYDSLVRKLMMKKRKTTHRMAADSFVSYDFKDSETAVRTAIPDYREFFRKQRKVKRVKGKIPYTVDDYLRDEGTDYWNLLPKERENDHDEFSDEET